MIQTIFKEIGGETRCIGYARVEYSSDDEDEIVEERDESELSDVFDQAKDRLNIPDSVDHEVPEHVADAVERGISQPRESYGWLRLKDGEIVFDEDYTRELEHGE